MCILPSLPSIVGRRTLGFLLAMKDQLSLEDDIDTVQLRAAWDRVLTRLQGEAPPSWFERFLKPLRPVEVRDGSVLVECPGTFVHDWVKRKYLQSLEQRVSDEMGAPLQIELTIVSRRDIEPVVHEAKPTVLSSPASEPSFAPCDRYSFDTFVVGQSNRMAHAGAKAVADQPGRLYNPLFIYGGSGLGKTHLLHAIAQSVLRREPKFKIVYVTAQEFAERFIEALRGQRIEAFRREQRNVQMWLVDDIQFIAGKDKTVEEVFHTFNHLYQQGKQIVLAGDRPPRELHLVDERLRSRFEAGLVADIQPPDTETRSAILINKARAESIDLETSVAMYLAEQVPGNIRVLEGCLTKFAAIGGIEGRPLDFELARELVERYYRHTSRTPSCDDIFRAVADLTQIPPETIKSKKRKAEIVRARQVSVYLIREIRGDSWTTIGDQFEMDHTSMMYAYQKLTSDMAHDPELRERVSRILRDLRPEQ
ncbi:MAG: chromosomal replication initiator protein DnaA [Fimbriimonadaceae bacterium]|nr:chromosomal replication initiator protein DnaA [Chthonomonadaceae bacterium]MCO5296690.1 chromosomal replication initiator protein DnaA [Fimbriimonadaceae bacterium]